MVKPQQLIFDWAPPAAPAFDNFLPGDNGEVLAHLRRFVDGSIDTVSLLLWGAPGSGRSHLLRAAAAEAQSKGRPAFAIGAASIPDAARSRALYVLDDADRLSSESQAGLFTLYNACRDAGAQLVLSSSLPAARTMLRDDLRTRIGAGLVLEVRPLADAEKPAALEAYAREQGFRLAPEVIAFLLTRGPRDMGALLANLRALDRYALAAKRQVTVPLVKELLGAHLDAAAARTLEGGD